MTLEYHLGDSTSPKGHALIYFRDGSDPNRVGASYVVILPVTVDISKYVPPFLAGQVEQLGSGDMSSFAFPPAPEPVPSEEWLRETAEKRGDDLLFGGAANLSDVTSLMEVVAGISAEYASQYDETTASIAAASDSNQVAGGDSKTGAVTGEGAPTDDVSDVMYGMMSEPDLLTELTTLMGRFQYESSGGDTAGARESEAKIRSIGRHVPENRRIDLLIEAATDGKPESAKRAQLYLERAFAMYREDYTRVHAIEQEIQTLSSDPLS
ncbi:hypothetical protein [Candidatus Lucifugimonas marina]|jgi:hypothetical protein|uniref:Uncharacterized protein n=1 Tax=Candidatus Lucifugimonas marina TaxID=3038979 RepID=A0AAJ5ZJJ4_9CHLR|nr:hypothetical protein [SAR202 cluster bacterium JH702]MDG0868708.1 hypothetical protein [SAR202 cluster bacterium JH639]WFG35340.1 hypothetical protein GKN94_06420 [SAR202 cluster bacterium JH545]WFG39288.1 hypothetical protein GKO48_06540 [SAR202 cluster bacterium JH1073]